MWQITFVVWYTIHGDSNPFVVYLVVINYTGNESLFISNCFTSIVTLQFMCVILGIYIDIDINCLYNTSRIEKGIE